MDVTTRSSIEAFTPKAGLQSYPPNAVSEKHGLFNADVAQKVIVALTFVGFTIMLSGIVANIINLVVFRKQGYGDAINISLTSLAVSDLANLQLMAWTALTNLFSYFVDSDWAWNLKGATIGTVLYPRIYFSEVSSHITVYMAIERCVAVTKPLHVKTIFTKRCQMIVLIAIYVVNAVPLIRGLVMNRLGWIYEPSRNKSYLGVVYGNGLYNQIGMVWGIVSRLSSFIIVGVCAIFLTYTLSRQFKWRPNLFSKSRPSSMPPDPESESPKRDRGFANPIEVSISDSAVHSHTPDSFRTRARKTHTSSTHVTSPNNLTSFNTMTSFTNTTPFNRNKRAALTVVLLAFTFVVCFLPLLIWQAANLAVPEFSIGGQYEYANRIFFIVGWISEAMCASVNIIIYLKARVKFRETFLATFCSCYRRGP